MNKLNDAEISNMYSSPSIITVPESQKLWWSEVAA
jgi:hypothetical protein